ncbi:MAG: hypothetical protein AAFS10_08380, partial [Myxococcota bacterium]
MTIRDNRLALRRWTLVLALLGLTLVAGVAHAQDQPRATPLPTDDAPADSDPQPTDTDTDPQPTDPQATDPQATEPQATTNDPVEGS